MTTRRPLMLVRAAAAAALIALAACGGGEESELDRLDDTLAGNDVDPAVTSALHDPIMVDPELSGQSHANAVRPPETPTQAFYPLEDGGGAGRALGQLRGQMAEQGGSPCGAAFDFDDRWAQRLPAAFAVYPGSSVTESAGNDSGGCAARVVVFNAPASARQLLDWYRRRAQSAGYSAEYLNRQGHHVLSGTSGDNAYYLIVTPRTGGSEVALIASGGR